jgi:hypothetical protein
MPLDLAPWSVTDVPVKANLSDTDDDVIAHRAWPSWP